jgi:hypothetical protein
MIFSIKLKYIYVSVIVIIFILFFSSSTGYSFETPILTDEKSRLQSHSKNLVLHSPKLLLRNETPEYHINATFHPLLHSIDADMRFKIPKGFNKNHLIELYLNIWSNGYTDDSINIIDVRNEFGTQLNWSIEGIDQTKLQIELTESIQPIKDYWFSMNFEIHI